LSHGGNLNDDDLTASCVQSPAFVHLVLKKETTTRKKTNSHKKRRAEKRNREEIRRSVYKLEDLSLCSCIQA